VGDDATERIERIADSILDGHPVDWAFIESESDDSDRSLLRRLRVVAAIVRVHRTISGGVSSPRGAPLFCLPSKWGPLDVVEHVGAGAFADVYRACDPRLDRDVALKLLYHDDFRSEARSSVISEGRLLARVRHPNVVTIYGADRINGRIGLWMEFIHGRTLEQLLLERGVFAPHDALAVGIDLCRALSAVHSAGVLHRDVKAQNVVREKSGRVVLMDFGTGHESADAEVAAGLSGTPLYLAPELFWGHAASVQSDIYSLGVLLFHLVTRAYPVPGRSFGEVRTAHRDRRRVWLKDLRPDLPVGFIASIETALAADPERRFQSASEMAQALEGSALDRQPSAQRSLTWPAYMTLVAIVVGALAIAPRLLRRSDDAHPAPSTFAASGIGLVKQLAAHRLEVPQNTFVGRPSPDGRYLPYVDLNGNLCLQDLATGQSRRLTNNRDPSEGAGSEIAISPDGHTIAYTWRRSNGSNEMRLVNEDGSSPRLLFRRSNVMVPDPLQWSADGTQILAMLETTAGTIQLVLVSVATGSVRLVEAFQGGQYHPTLSPDARFVAFDQPQELSTGARDIFIISTDDGTTHRIIEHAANDLFPLWTGDGRLLFVSDRTGSLALWAVRMAGAQPTDAPVLLVRDVGRLAGALGLTANGALFYRLQNGMVDVYVQSVHSDYTASDAANPVSSTLLGTNMSSEWSPDGTQLAYVAMRGLVQNDRYSRVLVVRDIESGRERSLRPGLSAFIQPRWSPDGRKILVRGIDAHNREGIFLLDLESGRTREAVLFPSDAVYPATLQWSHDGTALLYDNGSVGAIVAHDLVSGQEHVIVNYKSESIQRLTQWPGFRVSHDGNSIAYTGMIFHEGKADTVVIVRRLGGTAQEIARATSPERVEFEDWMPDDRGVLVVTRNTKDRRNVLCEARLDGSSMRPLGISAPAIVNVSLRRDGKAITYTAGMNSTELWVLENFLSLASSAGGKD
jgi:serine/threonine protein kinase